jgi:hypothetical protein
MGIYNAFALAKTDANTADACSKNASAAKGRDRRCASAMMTCAMQ